MGEHTPQSSSQRIYRQDEAFLATVNTVDPNCGGATVVNLDIATAAALDQVAFAESGAAVGEPAPHHYVVVDSPSLTWEQARDAAKLRGEGCDLATITSAEEQAIINGLLGPSSGFAGTQDYWIGGIQTGASTEPGGHWQWINGEGEFWNSVNLMAKTVQLACMRTGDLPPRVRPMSRTTPVVTRTT